MKKFNNIYECYKDLFYKMYGQKPVINFGQCGKLLTERLESYSEETICDIIRLYFEEERTTQVFHLPSILCAYSVNKYIGKLQTKVDSAIFNNAEEFNNED